MKLIDFLKDRVAYIVVYYISVSLAILIISLTVSLKFMENIFGNVIYAFMIATVLLIIFLIYEYSKVREFYTMLQKAMNSENMIEDMINLGQGKTIEQKLYSDLLKKLHKAYKDNIFVYEEFQKQYTYFINQWVHQMKTPVSVINLILQEESTRECKEAFDSIGEENEKISQGLNIMLYNARINQFNRDFNVEDIDILLILRQVINDNKKLLIRKQIFPQINGDAAVVHTDKKWMYFVINQIIINAIKYTDAAQRQRKVINLNIKEDTEKVTVGIKDNGIGIPKEDITRVFQAFFTGKNGRKTSESTGMGLYLSKRICEELGNELYVESQEDEGTEFIIVFYKSKNIFQL